MSCKNIIILGLQMMKINSGISSDLSELLRVVGLVAAAHALSAGHLTRTFLRGASLVTQ